ncbi:MAG: RNA-guided endonuclease InsQ/TnpB family protein [Waterburya sp.]
MFLVEKHIIKLSNKYFKEIDKMSFLSKNLFNSTLYVCRQAFFKGEKIPSFNALYHQLKSGIDYKALPSKVAQLVIKQVSNSFNSYIKALIAYRKDSTKFLGKPKLPKYKDKERGRNILTFNYQAVSKVWLDKGMVAPSGLQLKLKTKISCLQEVRLIPSSHFYVAEIVYEHDLPKVESNNRIASVDIGLNNLATVGSNCPDFKPFIVCGKALKSCNQQYNKTKALLQSQLPKNRFSSHKIQALTNKRNAKMDYYLHTASRFIIDRLVKQDVTHLIIGKNDNWKQNLNLGKRTNQSFNAIPHARFIQQLEYKAQLAGIKVTLQEESYTSKCSFLDLEPIKKQPEYLGKRVKRGLFRALSGKKYNADLNGSLNILRKVVGDSIFDRDSIERLVVSPLRFQPYKAGSLDICP